MIHPPSKQHRPRIPKMIQRRSHLHDQLERLERLARFFQHFDRELAHRRFRVVNLREEQTDLPFWDDDVVATELREVLGCEGAHALEMEGNQLRSAKVWGEEGED